MPENKKSGSAVCSARPGLLPYRTIFCLKLGNSPLQTGDTFFQCQIFIRFQHLFGSQEFCHHIPDLSLLPRNHRCPAVPPAHRSAHVPPALRWLLPWCACLQSIHCDLIEIRDDPVNPERLVPELAFLHNGVNRSGSRTFPVIEHQIGRVHVSVFPVRSSDLMDDA